MSRLGKRIEFDPMDDRVVCCLPVVKALKAVVKGPDVTSRTCAFSETCNFCGTIWMMSKNRTPPEKWEGPWRLSE